MKKRSLTLIATVLALSLVLGVFPSPVTAEDNGTIDVGGYKVTLSASPAYAGTAVFLNNYDNTIAVRAELTDVGRFGNWSFSGWIINGQEDSSLSYLVYVVTADTTIVARFEEQYDIKVSASPSEGGTVTGGGLYTSSTDATVNATPATGWKFVHWKEGNDVITTDPNYSFTPDCDRSLTAVFERDPDYVNITVTANPSEGGVIIGAGYYKKGDTVVLTAGPAKGWKFTGWDEGGPVFSRLPQIGFTAESDRNLTAKFEQLKYTVEFRDYDDFLLGGGDFSYGKTPYFAGNDPTRPEDDKYYYVFTGWDPALEPLTDQDDTVTYKYTAQYTQYNKYILTGGAGGQYVIGSEIPLEFIFQPAAGDDPLAIEHFTGASVDDTALSEGTDYTVKAGSVVLDLLPEYLDSLSAGNHTLKVQFDGRFDVDVDVNIVVPPPSNPKTGVSGNMGLYAGILIIAVLAAFGLIARRMKQNRMK